MTVVIMGIALLLLAFAVVLLFAMMGELASRLPDPDRDPGLVVPLADFKAGVSPGDWPGTLSSVGGERSAVLLVLSTACASCNRVAAELASFMAGEMTGLGGLGVVVSSSTQASGEEFMNKHALGHVPHVIDERGQWVMENFGVHTSPAALIFKDCMLSDAYTFSKLGSLRDRVLTARKVHHE